MIYCTLIESLKPRKLHQRKNDNDYEIPNSVIRGVDDSPTQRVGKSLSEYFSENSPTRRIGELLW
jgi:hypothetical protein